jgi:hypothetical protein
MHDYREKVRSDTVERLAWAMQAVEHQKQAPWAMHGAVAETTQSRCVFFTKELLCVLCVFAVNGFYGRICGQYSQRA